MGSTEANGSAPIFTSLLEDSSAAGGSLLSRLGLPFRQRGAARNVADFQIRIDGKPFGKYTAGDRVRGAVILTIVKRVRITHLTVALHGYVKAFKTPGAGADAPINPAEISSGTSSRFKYRGNGLATLFSDEQVLSADGPLEPRKYEFQFELEFPERSLPTSIDFERGTISYMVTATLTRPTTMSPVTTCEHKVRVIEQIDIGLLRAPRPRTITLEPISKKLKRRRPTLTGRNSIASSEVPDAASDHGSMRVLEDSNENATSSVLGTGDTERHEADTPHQSAPQSPVQSQSEIRSISGDSAISSTSANTGRSRNGDLQVGWSPAPSQSDSNRKVDRDGRTITAVIQQQKGGCLPGDHVAVIVSVQHIKRIKHSMHGVIVTLYRQSRIDVAPPLSVYGDKAGMSAKDLKRLERDEYYPKSRTGLGGLSLSSAGSYNVFRKDLSQSFSPLILDPATLSASVKTWVRVPEDAFPTIKGIPGDMISFKYHIEVLVDLGGRLAGQLQVNSFAQSRQNVMYTGAASIGPSPFEAASGQVSITGPGILGTERLKRERGVISVIHEIVIGTMDSSRVERAALPPAPSISVQSHADETRDDAEGESESSWAGRPEHDDGETVTHDLGPDHEVARPAQTPQYPLWRHSQSYTSQAPAPIYVPPPQMPDESGLTEKERVRRAEQQLLPSKPPGTTSRTISFADASEDIYDSEPGPSRRPNWSSHTVAADADASAPDHAATAPTLEDIESRAADASQISAPTDDKLERERNRLLQEASAPPAFPADYDDAHAASSSAAASAQYTEPSALTMVHGEDNAPSAPTMDDEDDGYGPAYAHSALARASGGTVSGPAEQLPRYER